MTTRTQCDWWIGEQAVLVRDVPGLLPRGPKGRRIHIATVYRWVQSGLRGVRLRAYRCGARLATTSEELNRFFAAVTDRWTEGDHAPDPERLKVRGLV